MTATWRKQPPTPSRQNIGVRNQPRFTKPARTCRRCSTEIEDTMRYCWPHWHELSDIQKANLRTLTTETRP